MAYPVLEFGYITYGDSTIFSNENEANAFSRLRGDFTNGQNTITNISTDGGSRSDGAPYYGLSNLKVGMVLVSSGEISGETTITNINTGTSTITVSDNAIASATNQLIRVRPQKGLYVVSGSTFNKNGNGEPQNLNSVTGSNDSEYDSNTNKWGMIAKLSETGSVSGTIIGSYGQYEITDVIERSLTAATFYISSSNDLGATFTEDSGSQISNAGSVMLLAQISTENGLMPALAAEDVGAGGQGLALAAYNLSVASVFQNFSTGSSGAGFPFTGSAEITGSLGITGSVETLINSSENFLIKNASAPTQSLFQIDNDGVAVFRAREGGDGAPSAVLGGLYFTTESAFLGVD